MNCTYTFITEVGEAVEIDIEELFGIDEAADGLLQLADDDWFEIVMGDDPDNSTCGHCGGLIGDCGGFCEWSEDY